MLCLSLAPPCPFVLVHLIGRLDELQEATLASLMEMMALRSGHPSLGTPLSREEGLKRVLCHPHGAHFLTLLGNKVTNQVSTSPFPHLLHLAFRFRCSKIVWKLLYNFKLLFLRRLFQNSWSLHTAILILFHILSSDPFLLVYRRVIMGSEAAKHLRSRVPDTHYAAIQDSQACPEGTLRLTLYSFCTNHSVTSWVMLLL